MNILLEKTTTFYSQIVICFYNSIVMFVQDVNVADRRNIAKENIIIMVFAVLTGADRWL